MRPTLLSEGDKHYSAALLHSAAEVSRLWGSKGSLEDGVQGCHARAFFASVSEKYWTACIVVVRLGSDIAGVLYAKEKLLAGVPTGIMYSDGVLWPVIEAKPLHRQAVLDTAARFLFASAGARGLRMIVPLGGFEKDALAGVAHSMALEIASCGVETHSRLVLPCSYDGFLRTLGSRTRRNFRYYSRRSQAAGNQYIDRLSIEDFSNAAWNLRGKSRIKADAAAVRRAVNILSTVDDPFFIGLRHRNGDWLSIAGGWYRGSGATLFIQMNNDREFAPDSLATVLRAHLIETFISEGIDELNFWAGTGGPLARYVQPIPATSIYMDVPTRGWRTLRSLVGYIGDLLPRRNAQFTTWISPSQVRNFDKGR